jgi:hypothetical protein
MGPRLGRVKRQVNRSDAIVSAREHLPGSVLVLTSRHDCFRQDMLHLVAE